MQARLTRRAPRAIVLGLVLSVAFGSQLATAADPSGPLLAAPRTVAPEPAAETNAFVPGNIRLSFSRIARGLSSPVFITHSGDNNGRLFVVEQTGRIRVIRRGVLLSAPFLDLRSKISTAGGEQGLLGLAFHPDYSWNRKFYVNYTDRNGDTVIEQYLRSTTDASRAEPTGKLVIRIGQPYSNHNGGMLAFGPDRYLYVGMGDGGGAGDPGNRAQNINSLLGKMLRLNIDTSKGYTIPPTNPYVGRSGNDLIWSLGLRNPWRWSFDRQNGNLWIGDVGQVRYEEVNRSVGDDAGRGTNYGWRQLEGRVCYSPSSGCNTTGKKMPLAVYGHSLGCSITGGYVYRGTTYPDLRGAYLFGDYCSGRIWGVDAGGRNTQTPVQLYDTGANISSFGEDQAGNLYMVDRKGDIWLIKDV